MPEGDAGQIHRWAGGAGWRVGGVGARVPPEGVAEQIHGYTSVHSATLSVCVGAGA